MIQLTRRGGALGVSEDELNSLSCEFSRHHCIRLPQFLDASLLGFVHGELEHAEFFENLHGGIGKELHMKENNASALLRFVTNNPSFLAAIQRITNCGPIAAFSGRVYCLRPASGDYDNWHSDIVPAQGRMCGLSINLTGSPFAGGLFRMREQATGKVLIEVANTGYGDAILFRIAEHLEHKVSKVEGDVARVVFAGWFSGKIGNYFEDIRSFRKSEA